MRRPNTSTDRSTRGESLVESLVAILVGALSTMLLASIITSAKSLINDGKVAMDSYYQGDVKVAERKAAGSDSGALSGKQTINLSDGANTIKVEVQGYKNEAFGVPVISYKKVGA